jgi:hypothetical protein
MNSADRTEIEIGGIRVPRGDWEVTPASVQALVATLLHTMASQQEQLAELSNQLPVMSVYFQG